MICFAFLPPALGEGNYAIVKGKVYFSDHARVVFNRIRMEADDGLTLVVPLKEVDAYKVDDKVFHRLPLVCLNGEEKGDALLHLVGYRNGLSLYRCDKLDETLGCCFEDNTGNISTYFVYKDHELYLRVDEKNAWTVFPFFGIQALKDRKEL
jgi:hypothetical protein